MPRWLTRSVKLEWDVFPTPEVEFFDPNKHGLLAPASLTQTCVLLSDREYLGAVIAGGDPGKAASNLRPKFDPFWLSPVPQAEALPYLTIRDRMEQAMTLMARLIDQVRSLDSRAGGLPATGHKPSDRMSKPKASSSPARAAPGPDGNRSFQLPTRETFHGESP